jgi:asparagine synthase (glutamine-hydrolysing)
MLKKIENFASLYRELGPRWSAFRLSYAFRLRTGLIRLQMPRYHWVDRPLETWLKKDIPSDATVYTEWRKQNSPKFFFDEQPAGRVAERVSRSSRLPPNIPWNQQTAVDEADRILNGEIKYFAHEFHQIGFPPSWHQDPISKTQLDSTKHWSQISDEGVIARRTKSDEAISEEHTDIKFIWEPNRFAFVYTLVRAYAATQDEKYAEAFWTLINDWAEHNPPNIGPNWMDGQEIALRLMAWTFGYYQFSNSPSATPQRLAQFTQFVAAQSERIYKNIDYAISTRSNHNISEAAGLWLVGLLFPELKDSEKYLSMGREFLEREAAAQIFPDGSYAMYSVNYHRFVLHIYLYAICLGKINHSPFSTQLQNSIANSITYLSHLIDPQTGKMPVYGSNDGALVLPLNNCDFTDYRPLLQLGYYITKGKRLFESGEWDEDISWLCGMSSLFQRERVPEGQVRENSPSSFPIGGIYLLRGPDSKAILHCTDFRARPSHADQLHMDLWLHGHNIACDAGTYLYSGEGRRWRNGLARTSVHNTVILDNKDQMTMVSRFTWTNWSKGKALKHQKNLWQGEHDGYKPVSHKRTVMVLEDDRWFVIDNLSANDSHHYALHWLLNDFPFVQKDNSVLLSLNGMKYEVQVGLAEGNYNFSLVRADPNSTRGWRSRYYGHKEPAISVMLEANQPRVTFWSFFGFENDVVEIEGNYLKVNSKVIPLAE